MTAPLSRRIEEIRLLLRDICLRTRNLMLDTSEPFTGCFLGRTSPCYIGRGCAPDSRLVFLKAIQGTFFLSGGLGKVLFKNRKISLKNSLSPFHVFGCMPMMRGDNIISFKLGDTEINVRQYLFSHRRERQIQIVA
jgi:hypothetical protein